MSRRRPRHKHPTNRRGRGVFSYRGFEIRRDEETRLYVIDGGRDRHYQAWNVEHARQIIDAALDP